MENNLIKSEKSKPDLNKKINKVCVFTDDRSTYVAKTSFFLIAAAQRLGWFAFTRDSFVPSYSAELFTNEKLARYAYLLENVIVQKDEHLFEHFGANRILSLDLNWLFTAKQFFNNERIERIDSIWFDDLRTACLHHPTFPMSNPTFEEAVRHPKVHHFFYGEGQIEEAQLLGFSSKNRTMLAAPKEYLAYNDDPEIFDRAAFIGNPGLPLPPSPEALKALKNGEDLPRLRELARDQVIGDFDNPGKQNAWQKECPQTKEFLIATMEKKRKFPEKAAMSLLVETGKEFPSAFTYLNERRDILDAALLVKTVLRYDRPALVHRLYSHNLIDVYSGVKEWKYYEIDSHPIIRFPELPKVYQKYSLHANAANCAREAAANEKLFEIAACARLSLNIDAADLRRAYSPEEIELVSSLEEVEEKTRTLLKNRELVLARGKKARKKTAQTHLWDHRLEALDRHE